MRAGLQRARPWPSVVLVTQNKSHLFSFQLIGTDLKCRSSFPVIKFKVSSCFPGCYSLLCQLLVEQSQIPEVLAFSNEPPLPPPHKRYICCFTYHLIIINRCLSCQIFSSECRAWNLLGKGKVFWRISKSWDLGERIYKSHYLSVTLQIGGNRVCHFYLFKAGKDKWAGKMTEEEKQYHFSRLKNLESWNCWDRFWHSLRSVSLQS